MAQTAVADGPVAFFTDQGKQLSIPLQAITFEGDVVKCSIQANGLLDWLQYLVAQKRLRPGPVPAPVDAIVFTAAFAGSNGNGISVDVEPNGASLDVVVTEGDTYDGLSLDPASDNFVVKILGASGGPAGKKPGLVRVQGAVALPPSLPRDGRAMLASPPTDPPTWVVGPSLSTPPGSPVTAIMTLEARSGGSEKGKWRSIDVSNVDPVAQTFTLTVAWTATATIAASAPPPFPSPALQNLAFSVAVTEPTPGGGLKVPKQGTVALSGGAEPAPALNASATLVANG